MIAKQICVLLCCQSFLCTKHSFLTKVIFIQGAFKNIQELLWKIQGLFKEIPQFFNFQGPFLGHDRCFFKDFLRPVQTM